MSDGNFAEYIQGERDRLNALRETALEARAEIDDTLAGIDREFKAIDAYEAAKSGKALRPASSDRQTRPRRGSRREELLELIGQNNGLSRGDILDRMGLKGDKSGEMSVSNALTSLTKRGQITREGGKYYAAAGAETMRRAAE